MIEIDAAKVSLLGNAFRGLWLVREPTSKTRRAIRLGDKHREFDEWWCVTFKYKDDYIETDPCETINEALGYAITFLGLK